MASKSTPALHPQMTESTGLMILLKVYIENVFDTENIQIEFRDGNTIGTGGKYISVTFMTGLVFMIGIGSMPTNLPGDEGKKLYFYLCRLQTIDGSIRSNERTMWVRNAGSSGLQQDATDVNADICAKIRTIYQAVGKGEFVKALIETFEEI